MAKNPKERNRREVQPSSPDRRELSGRELLASRVAAVKKRMPAERKRTREGDRARIEEATRLGATAKDKETMRENVASLQAADDYTVETALRGVDAATDHGGHDHHGHSHGPGGGHIHDEGYGIMVPSPNSEAWEAKKLKTKKGKESIKDLRAEVDQVTMVGLEKRQKEYGMELPPIIKEMWPRVKQFLVDSCNEYGIDISARYPTSGHNNKSAMDFVVPILEHGDPQGVGKAGFVWHHEMRSAQVMKETYEKALAIVRDMYICQGLVHEGGHQISPTNVDMKMLQRIRRRRKNGKLTLADIKKAQTTTGLMYKKEITGPDGEPAQVWGNVFEEGGVAEFIEERWRRTMGAEVFPEALAVHDATYARLQKECAEQGKECPPREGVYVAGKFNPEDPLAPMVGGYYREVDVVKRVRDAVNAHLAAHPEKYPPVGENKPLTFEWLWWHAKMQGEHDQLWAPVKEIFGEELADRLENATNNGGQPVTPAIAPYYVDNVLKDLKAFLANRAPASEKAPATQPA